MKKNLAKLICLMLVLSLCFACLAACGKPAAEQPAAEEPAAEEPAAEEPAAEEPAAEEPAAEEPAEEYGYYELNFSLHDPATSNNGKFYQAWADKLSELTDGHVTVNFFWSASLYAAADVADGVEDGGVDLGWVYTTFYPNQFPLSDVITFPMCGFGDPEVSTNVLWDLMGEYPELGEEWSAYKLLNLYGNPGMLFGSLDKPITSAADLKGLTVRSPAGPITDLLAKCGANPTVMAPPDMFESLEKRNITAFVFEPAGICNFALQDVTDYFTNYPLYDGAFALVMNWDKWNELPAAYQEIIESLCGREGSLAAAADFGAAAEAAHETIAAAGAEWVELGDEAIAEFQTMADEVNLKWAGTYDELTAADYTAYLARAMEIAKTY